MPNAVDIELNVSLVETFDFKFDCSISIEFDGEPSSEAKVDDKSLIFG